MTKHVTSEEIALIAAEAASDKKAEGIVALDVSQLLVVTEYFLICTGRTNIQVRAIADEIEEQIRAKAKLKPMGREGADEAKWILLDFGDVVVHVFQPEERDFYRLERLWGDAPHLPLDVEGALPVRVGGSRRAEDEAAADAIIAEPTSAE